MKYKMYLMLIILFSSKLHSQVSLDSNQCINEYVNDIPAASLDTCKVNLILSCEEDSSGRCIIPSIENVKNLYSLGITTGHLLRLQGNNFRFKHLSDVYVQAIIDSITFPSNFFSSKSLSSVILSYLNEIVTIPNALMSKTFSSRNCGLILLGNNKFKNSSKKFYFNLRSLIQKKEFKSIELHECYFTVDKQKELKKLSKPNKLIFYNKS